MFGTMKRSRAWLAIASLAVVALVLSAALLVKPEQSPARTLATWFWKLDFWVFPVTDDAKLAALHSSASQVSRERCVACHEDKTGSKLVLHRIHLRSDVLKNIVCHDCHRQVSLTARGNTAVVTWVDVGFCKKCHSPFPGLQPGSPMRPEYFERDCTTCHKGDRAPKHAQPYLSQSIPSTECKGCHGGRVLPSTIRHERSDWLQTHGAEALAVGADACFQCHDFGLKFCDDCHKKKPPSHQPAERWRAVHPEAARADTRVCYSCHRTSFCKKCHLNHEAGWMEKHPAFVREKGDSSCGECHSKSACGYCHMLTLSSLGSAETP